MKFSDFGLDLLKRSEGFRGTVYKDVVGYDTIGYGHKLLRTESFPNGISESAASDLLVADVNASISAVQRLVKVPLTQGQFDALVDFTFNLGTSRLAGSTLLELLNKGEYGAAAKQLLLWDHAGGKELAALTTRRKAEKDLWLGGTGV
jgi:lysozyme